MALVKRDRPLAWPAWVAQGLPDLWRSLELPEGWNDRDAMRLEEYREDGTLVVKAEIPGIDPDKDIEITVDNGVLEISAERQERQEEKDEKAGFYRSEFRYGSFLRRLPLPPGAQDEDVVASYKDGILEVRVPVAEAGAPVGRKIPVEHN